jgi:hypothetical protein
MLTRRSSTNHAASRRRAADNLKHDPGAPHVHDLRVSRVACGDARRAATEYLSSYAAYNAIGGGVVAFVTHRAHGAARLSNRKPKAVCRTSRATACPGKGAMSFVAPIAPMRGCPTFTSFSEAIVGGLVTRNSSCRELEAFVERFPSYGPKVGGFPAPLTHIVVTWPSLLPNGHGPVPMNYTCTYRIPAGSTAEGWSCNDGYFAYGFQYEHGLPALRCAPTRSLRAGPWSVDRPSLESPPVDAAGPARSRVAKDLLRHLRSAN